MPILSRLLAFLKQKRILFLLLCTLFGTTALLLFMQSQSKPKQLTPPSSDLAQKALFPPEQVWIANVSYNPAANAVGITDVATTEGFAPDYQTIENRGYTFHVIDGTGVSLFAVPFAFPGGVIFAYGEPLVADPSETLNASLLIPFFENAKLFQVRSEAGEILSETPVPQPRSHLVKEAFAQGQSYKTLRYNGNNKKKLDILFVGQQFANQDAFNREVEKAHLALIGIDPFDDAATNINVHALFLAEPIPSCLTLMTSILAHKFEQTTCQRDLNNIIVKAPEDVVVVLYGNRSYFNTQVNAITIATAALDHNLPYILLVLADEEVSGLLTSTCQPTSFHYETHKVFIHEFGHAFGDFMDQYRLDCPGQKVNTPGNIPPPARFNCTTDPNAHFNAWQPYQLSNLPKSCFVENYYRATANSSIMNTPEFNWNGPLRFDPVEVARFRTLLGKYESAAHTPTTTNPAAAPEGSSFQCREESGEDQGTGLKVKRLVCDPN